MDKDTIAPSTTSERPLAGNSIPIAVPLNSNDIDSFGCSTLPWNRSPYLLRQCAPAFQNDGNVASTMMELSKTRLRTTKTSISSKTYNSSIFFYKPFVCSVVGMMCPRWVRIELQQNIQLQSPRQLMLRWYDYVYLCPFSSCFIKSIHFEIRLIKKGCKNWCVCFNNGLISVRGKK